MYRFQKWRDVLQLAPNAKTVNAIMRDYVQSLDPLVAVLPPECQRALRSSLDVQELAVTLLREELRFRGSGEVQDLLHEIAHTFASAAVRITLVHARPLLSAA